MKMALHSNIKDFIQIIMALLNKILNNNRFDTLLEFENQD